MRLTKILFGILFIAIAGVTSSFTSKTSINKNSGGWFFLGDKRVGFGVDHDVIHFANWKDDVRQLKLKITEGPMKMYDMKIHFDNGTIQDVSLRHRYNIGAESRIIDLDGGLRHLSKIEFWYETKGFARGRAKVAVWGRN
jgi:hypothetical protein